MQCAANNNNRSFVEDVSGGLEYMYMYGERCAVKTCMHAHRRMNLSQCVDALLEHLTRTVEYELPISW